MTSPRLDSPIVRRLIIEDSQAMIPSSRSIYYHSLGEKPRLFNRSGIQVEVQIEKVGNKEIVTCTSEDNDTAVCNMSLLCPSSNDASDAVAYRSYYQVCRDGDNDYFHCALGLGLGFYLGRVIMILF